MPDLHYDPGLKSTAICKSAISDIDGEGGKLRYRGYDIEELLARSSFLEVAFLLIYGELPTADELADWAHKVNTHTFVHVQLESLLRSFNYDAHPMGMFISAMAALSTFHKEANPALQGSDLYTNGNEAIINKQVLGHSYRVDFEDLGKDLDACCCGLPSSNRPSIQFAKCQQCRTN